MSQNFPASADTIASGDLAFGVNKIETVLLNTDFTASTASFTIPSYGSSVAISVVNGLNYSVGDTVLVKDGTHVLRGVVLASCSTSISILNCGYSNTSSSGTMASGASVVLAASPSGSSDFIYGYDDFVFHNIGAGAPWADTSINGGVSSYDAWMTDHPGIYSMPCGTAAGDNGSLIGNLSGSVGNYDVVKKAVFRFVVFFDSFFTSSDYGEYYWGLSNSTAPGNLTSGAVFSFDPNFAPGNFLICGNFDSSGNSDAITTFQGTAATWYDTILSWTPTAVKYYAAAYGQTPSLISTQTTHISTASQWPWLVSSKGANGSTSRTMRLDRVEWLLQVSQTRLFLGEGLINF